VIAISFFSSSFTLLHQENWIVRTAYHLFVAHAITAQAGQVAMVTSANPDKQSSISFLMVEIFLVNFHVRACVFKAIYMLIHHYIAIHYAWL
jgi:hypothetical protein